MEPTLDSLREENYLAITAVLFLKKNYDEPNFPSDNSTYKLRHFKNKSKNSLLNYNKCTRQV